MIKGILKKVHPMTLVKSSGEQLEALSLWLEASLFLPVDQSSRSPRCIYFIQLSFQCRNVAFNNFL